MLLALAKLPEKFLLLEELHLFIMKTQSPQSSTYTFNMFCSQIFTSAGLKFIKKIIIIINSLKFFYVKWQRRLT